MGTVVDSLILQLGLDATQLKRGSDEAKSQLKNVKDDFKKHGDDIEQTVKSVGYAMENFKLGLAALGGLAAMVFKQLADYAANLANQEAGLGRNAAAVRLNIRDYDLWRQTLENFAKGGGAEFEQTMDKLTQGIERFKLTGEWPEAFNFLRALHISPIDASTGQVKNALDLIKEVAAATNGMDAATAKTWAQGVGIPYQMLMFFRQSAEAQAKALKDTKDLGVLTEEQAKAAQDIWTAWSETQQVINTLVRTEMVTFKDQFLAILQIVRDITTEFKAWMETLKEPQALKDLEKILNFISDTRKSLSDYMQHFWERFLGIKPGSLFDVPPIDNLPGGGGGAGPPATFSERFRGETDTTQGNLTGSALLRSQRQRFADEMARDPRLRTQLAAIISLENEGAGTGVAESLMNRSALTGATLRQGIFGTPGIDHGRSFYGPVRSGLLEGRVRELERNPAHLARLNALIDQTLAGSNRILGYTDQGSAGDPNYTAGGIGVNIHGERFNDYRYPGARRFREEQQRGVNAEPPAIPTLPRGLPPAGTNSFVDRWSGINSTMSSTTNNSENHIGQIHINTQATDAVGIAKDIGGALDSHAFADHANDGPQ